MYISFFYLRQTLFFNFFLRKNYIFIICEIKIIFDNLLLNDEDAEYIVRQC